jgi:hypothetical protein
MTRPASAAAAGRERSSPGASPPARQHAPARIGLPGPEALNTRKQHRTGTCFGPAPPRWTCPGLACDHSTRPLLRSALYQLARTYPICARRPPVDRGLRKVQIADIVLFRFSSLVTFCDESDLASGCLPWLPAGRTLMSFSPTWRRRQIGVSSSEKAPLTMRTYTSRTPSLRSSCAGKPSAVPVTVTVSIEVAADTLERSRTAGDGRGERPRPQWSAAQPLVAAATAPLPAPPSAARSSARSRWRDCARCCAGPGRAGGAPYLEDWEDLPRP